jgi:hypothetical protein
MVYRYEHGMGNGDNRLIASFSYNQSLVLSMEKAVFIFDC